jgi:hypothetical protein
METNTETTATPASLAPTKPKAAKKPAKKAAPEKKAGGAKLVKQASGDRIPLKSLCAKLKIEPRLARRKLRAAELSFHDKRDRWNFTAAQAAKATEILRA